MIAEWHGGHVTFAYLSMGSLGSLMGLGEPLDHSGEPSEPSEPD